MQRFVCKSKIHAATVTDANLRYEGSITIDAKLLDAAQIRPYEQVQVVNLNNGSRIETYCLSGPSGSGTVCMNGPAARRAAIGDQVIIISYAMMSDQELATHHPTVVFVDARNQLQQVTTYGDDHFRSRPQTVSPSRRSRAAR